ncbi:MAG: zinc-ribbon domain containing protein, partial [Myxococcales bacterium]|nr:zinc-ribbon domain containing protein [Myxococcales bacterium]
NPRAQLARGAFDTPRYFYVDQPRLCVQCREEFVFRAGEQKRWYETLGFNFASVAIRCPACRRKRRSDKAMHHAVDDAKRALANKPDDAGAQLAVAEAIVELHARFGKGKLEQAVAAARKARRLLKDRPASARALTHYWEGRAQALREQEGAARECFGAFLEHAGARAHRQEILVAQKWLEQHPS